MKYKMGTFSSLPPSPRSSQSSLGTGRRTPTSDIDDIKMLDTIREQSRSDSLPSRPRNGLETMGEEAKRLMQSIKDLRSLGIEDAKLPLPKMCVVGGQSTGKSSLIEGISEIRVPRADDTCTRCPLEINLSESPRGHEQWNCTVTLVKKYIYDFTARRSAPTTDNLFGPWREQHVEEIHFCNLHQKGEVEDALRRAHLAILNPRNDPDSYKPGRDITSRETFGTSFSPNIVRLDIRGPNLPNLCFYDLPGVIEMDSEDANNVKLVKNLVRQFIEAPNCIILHTNTMNTDYQNNASGRFISHLKADDRTVGILTKPDCISQGSINQYKEILAGKKFHKKLGYFVVKNSQDPTIEHHIARQEEEEFFENSEPFSNKLLSYRHCFGTPKLQEALSTMLAKQIQTSLPSITSQIKARISVNERRLQELPKPIEGNVSLQVNNQLEQFASLLTKELKGGFFEHDFFSKWHKRATLLRNMLVGSYARVVFPPIPRVPSLIETVEISDDDNEEVMLTSTPSKLMGKTPTACQSYSRKRGGNFQPTIFSQGPVSTPPDPEAQKLAKLFKMGDIRQYIDGVNTGLSTSRDIKVTAKMHFESIYHWHSLLKDFLEDTQQLTATLLSRYFEKSFSQWSRTPMWECIETTIYEFHEKAVLDQKFILEEMLKMEEAKLIAMDVDVKQYCEREILQTLTTESREYMFKKAMVPYLQQAGERGISDNVKKDIRAEVEARPLEFEQEIQEMATARSYYRCASTRFADYVVLSVCTQLFERCREGLRAELAEKIGVNSADANQRCRDLLEPDKAIVMERTTLIEKQKSLHLALERLSVLERGD